ncbi:MAG: hypothetical protein OXG88_07505 [Gammaproteobacteria bacterium]|nr:hypothetical protein [Gammaproteobacteria bacterium]
MTQNPTIAVLGDKIEYTTQEVAINEIKFYKHNPRIGAELRKHEDFDILPESRQQTLIYELLLNETSVANLEPEILKDGGLQEPLIFRQDTRTVVEGNSRLAVYRKLKERHPDDIQWHKVRCYVFEQLTDDQEARIIGQAHLQGKTEWSGYAKAYFYYKWCREEGRGKHELKNIAGITTRDVNKKLRAFDLMQQNDDIDTTHFSHYEVLVASRSYDKIEDDTDLHDHVLKQILEGGHFTAQELRQKLPEVIKRPNALKRYKSGTWDLHTAFEHAQVNDVKQKLEKALEYLSGIKDRDIGRLEVRELKATFVVARKVKQNAERVFHTIEKEK